jgi:hypothetical protein
VRALRLEVHVEVLLRRRVGVTFLDAVSRVKDALSRMPSTHSLSKNLTRLQRSAALRTLRIEAAAARRAAHTASRTAGRGTPARGNNKHKGALTKKGGARRNITRRR